ncbi:acyltransferase family protein [Sphingomonas sp. GCM10030256]|uniref:acyltransferase family protein n=1 Tax=Sphingomonas sp. GCM10030256 TaxID=3273427 RepID=UPI003611BC94
MGQLRSIQVLRAVAAIGVVILHTSTVHGIVPDASAIGAAGVDLFFVISGVIMVTVGAHATPLGFLSRRAFRIYPMWLVAALPCLLAGNSSAAQVAATITLWPVYDTYVLPALDLGWTLSFEMLFYIAFAFSLRFGAAVPLVAYAVAFLAGQIAPGPLLDFIGNPMILEFLAGVLIARLPRSTLLAISVIPVAVLLASSAPSGLYAGDVARDANRAIFRVLWWGLPAALIVYSAITFERLFKASIWTAAVLLGNASYAIYLFHPYVLNSLDLPPRALVLAAVALGVALHLTLEPVLNKFTGAARRKIGGLRRDPTRYGMQPGI